VKVTALIPTYNRRTQVLRAIDSVIAQTLPVDEIIVVDDGSTDGSDETIRERYGPRVVLIRQENAGVSAARNRGVREAKGDWVAFLDSDDTWLPTKIERQVEALKSLGDDFGLCFTDCVFEGNPFTASSAFQKVGFEPPANFGVLDEPSQFIVESREPFWIQSLLVLRSLVGEGAGFDEAMETGEDTDLMFRLGFKTRFCYCSEPLVRVDRNPSRAHALADLFGAPRDDRKFDNWARMYARWLNMPEVSGTSYEPGVRNMLRTVFYNSAECKFHQLRIGLALREIGRLRSIGDSYPRIVATLLFRKATKLRRNRRTASDEGSAASADSRPRSARGDAF